MQTFQSDIREAIANAQPAEQTRPAVDPYWHGLREHPDSEAVCLNPQSIDDTRDRHPNVLFFRDPGGLQTALGTVSAMGALRLDGTQIQDILQHEELHANAALRAGARAVYLTLGFHRSPTGALRIRPATYAQQFTTTKLGVASYYAAPHRPSPSDQTVVEAMGYGNLFDLTQRIFSHNRAAENSREHLLLPNAGLGITQLAQR